MWKLYKIRHQFIFARFDHFLALTTALKRFQIESWLTCAECDLHVFRYTRGLQTGVSFSSDFALQNGPKRIIHLVNLNAVVCTLWSSEPWFSAVLESLELYETVPSPVKTSMVYHQNVCLFMSSKQSPQYFSENIAHLSWRLDQWKRLEIVHLQLQWPKPVSVAGAAS